MCSFGPAAEDVAGAAVARESINESRVQSSM